MIRGHHGAVLAIDPSQPLNHLVGSFASLRIDDFDPGLELMVLRARAGLPPIEDKGDGMTLSLAITGQALQQRLTRRFKADRRPRRGPSPALPKRLYPSTRRCVAIYNHRA